MASNGTIVDVPGIKIGHAQDRTARTGCSVVLTEAGSVCGVDVRGSAPGTRETDLLRPTALVEKVHAVVLCGGSAFGLDAAGGVVAFLEERGIGFPVGKWRVPIVPAAVIFDLLVGDGAIRPDRAMGYAAAKAASREPFAEGRVGAGTGATVGKLAGPDRAMRGGLGTASIRLPTGLVVGAIAVANAIGSIYDAVTHQRIAGPRTASGTPIDDRPLLLERKPAAPAGGNTTLAVVATNANLTKSQATKVAQMAHDGLARVIIPSHMMGDGDTIFACATGGIDALVDVIGTLGAEMVAEAIGRGVRAAQQ